jgi:thiosulfate dehydrogenase [quinone] large subunit
MVRPQSRLALRLHFDHVPWSRRALALARIAIGLDFANEATRKIAHGWLVSGADMLRTVQAYPSVHSGGFYHHFVTGVVLPHAALFAFLVTIGECLVAMSLTLGLFTRAGALTAMWLNLNYLLLKGPANPSAWIDWLFLFTAALILLTGAGRTWGLDGHFSATFARFPLAAWFAGGSRPARPPAPVTHQA